MLRNRNRTEHNKELSVFSFSELICGVCVHVFVDIICMQGFTVHLKIQSVCMCLGKCFKYAPV